MLKWDVFDSGGSAGEQSGAAAPAAEDQESRSSSDLFDSIFHDQPREAQSASDDDDDQDPEGSRNGGQARRDDQAGDETGEDGDPAKPNKQQTPDSQGLVEVELGGQRVKVSAEVAAAIEAQRIEAEKQSRDYKELQAEFTRRNQETRSGSQGGKDQPKDGPDSEVKRKAREQALQSYDKKLFEAFDLQDGKGAGETILEMINRQAPAAAQRVMQDFIEQEFEPLRNLIAESLGPQIMERQVQSAVEEIQQQYGIEGLDAKAVHAETQRLAKAQNRSIDRDLMLTAALRVLAGRKATNDPNPSPNPSNTAARPNAPRQSGMNGGQPATPSPGKRGVVHRHDPLDAL